jgi:hypothetical protein
MKGGAIVVNDSRAAQNMKLIQCGWVSGKGVRFVHKAGNGNAHGTFLLMFLLVGEEESMA